MISLDPREFAQPRLSESANQSRLASVVFFARNIESPDQLARLTARLRAEPGMAAAEVLAGKGQGPARHPGVAAVLQSDNTGFDTLHVYFLDRLVPVCAQLLDTAADSGEIRSDMEAVQLMRGAGNLCIGAENNPHYDARRLVELLIAGLRLPH